MLATTVLLAGCDPAEKISVYTVPTHESVQTPEFLKASAAKKPKPSRMLAAIAPEGSFLWFFKLQGPPDDVASHEAQFRQLLASLRFNDAKDPEWTLPETWRAKRGNQMRFATLIVSEDPPLEVSVTRLPAGDDLQQGILDNINRWRNQVDLPFIELDDLPLRTEKIEAGSLTVTYLNILGKSNPSAAMPGMPPGGFPAAGNPATGTPASEIPVSGEPDAPAGPSRNTGSAPPSTSDMKFDKPAEWTQVRPKQFITAAFEVAEGPKKLSITVSRAGGSKAANINRWRGQMGLEPLSDEQAAESQKKFPLGDRSAELVEIKGDSQTMLVIMIDDEQRTVFVKLMGDPELAVRERSRFEGFVRSLKF